VPAERFHLGNGLEVVLLPDRATQVVAIEVWYEAGTRHDPAGKAGLAQLFERLMFAGSTHVPAAAMRESWRTSQGGR
jgi:predicted Zn-dependent peptidase